jgi:hypothetical protein
MIKMKLWHLFTKSDFRKALNEMLLESLSNIFLEPGSNIKKLKITKEKLRKLGKKLFDP